MNRLFLLPGAILLLATLSTSMVINSKCENNDSAPHITAEDYAGYEKQITHIKYENCRIETIDKKAFNWLFNLKYFQIVDNGVPITLAPGLFSNNHILEELVLINSITIHQDIFKDLSHLKVLKLENHEIKILPKQLFWNIPDLETISLKNNSISIIDEYAFNFNEELTSISHDKVSEVHIDLIFENLTKLNLSFNDVKHIEWRLFTINLKSLDISVNNLSVLPENIFKNLTQLVNLDLNNNQLSSLPKLLFASLGLLEKLDLSSNVISSLDPETFTHNTELINLTLRHNQLTELQAGLFINLKNLQYLSLEFNQIQHIHNRVFPPSARSVDIYLQHNNLQTLDVSVFEDLQEKIPNDAVLNLHENPWICDCRLEKLVNLWKRKSHDQPMFFVPKCEAPKEFSEEWWNDLNLDQLCLTKD